MLGCRIHPDPPQLDGRTPLDVQQVDIPQGRPANVGHVRVDRHEGGGEERRVEVLHGLQSIRRRQARGPNAHVRQPPEEELGEGEHLYHGERRRSLLGQPKCPRKSSPIWQGQGEDFLAPSRAGGRRQGGRRHLVRRQGGRARPRDPRKGSLWARLLGQGDAVEGVQAPCKSHRQRVDQGLPRVRAHQQEAYPGRGLCPGGLRTCGQATKGRPMEAKGRRCCRRGGFSSILLPTARPLPPPLLRRHHRCHKSLSLASPLLPWRLPWIQSSARCRPTTRPYARAFKHGNGKIPWTHPPSTRRPLNRPSRGVPWGPLLSWATSCARIGRHGGLFLQGSGQRLGAVNHDTTATDTTGTSFNNGLAFCSLVIPFGFWNGAFLSRLLPFFGTEIAPFHSCFSACCLAFCICMGRRRFLFVFGIPP
ncbi:uncharacterized protein IWZ02DRAFT_459147 [Phyllosticta citriasiana]|uniref:uncharacterized protein n=1 Tax=Phyllosticta citriasiana TaxID=595635 RepID=UPI0030FD6E95